MKMLRTHARILIPLVVLGIFLLGTNPSTLPIYALPVPFLLFLAGCFFACDAILHSLKVRTSIRKIISLGFSLSVVSLLALSSMNQLTVRDGILMLVFVSLFVGYMYRLQLRG